MVKMGTGRVYLDHAATTPVHPEVVAAMLPYLSEVFGNPSSSHSFGIQNRTALLQARVNVAGLIGAEPQEIVFTSGGTEANNFALKGVAYANLDRGRHIVVSSIEHHSVLESCRFLESQGFEVTYLPVDRFGIVSPDDVRRSLRTDTVLVSVMHANNEVGAIQPVTEIAGLVRPMGIIMHIDAVQTAGLIGINVVQGGADLVSLSGHKLYGPKGAGALYVRKGVKLVPFMNGGGQDTSLRAGTANVAACVGFGRAAMLAGRDAAAQRRRLTRLALDLYRTLKENIGGVWLNGPLDHRLPGTLNLGFAGVDGKNLAAQLDRIGIAVSTGSACTSDSGHPSHVLRAMGQDEARARSALRISMGKGTTEEQVERVAALLPAVVTKLRSGMTRTG